MGFFFLFLPLVDSVTVCQHSECCYVVSIRIQITLETPKKHEKSLRFVEDPLNHLKFVPRAFQDPGKHKVVLLCIVPNAKKPPLAEGKPDSLQGVLELEHFESGFVFFSSLPFFFFFLLV